MFPTYRELIITIVLILSPVSNSREISSDDGNNIAKEIIAGATNQTVLEGQTVQLNCEVTANVTVQWFWKGVPIEVTSLKTRISTQRNGSLRINPVSPDDSGHFLCGMNNSFKESQTASTYLNVEYPAKVTFTPTIQYLPFRSEGVVQCHIKANPPLQYVTWTKDKRLLEPSQTKDILILNNGSLLFTSVNQNHQGNYTCTPYNSQGTQGSSGRIQVLVRKPPSFTVKPKETYQCKIGETVEMHCDAQAEDGTQNPAIQWQRPDEIPLPKNRVRISGGNITIEGLQRSDFGFYQCVASNEVTTIVAATQLVLEGTQPYGPYNFTGIAMVPATSSGSTLVKIDRLSNSSEEDMESHIITVHTLDADITHNVEVNPAPSLPSADDLEPAWSGPNPSSPGNVTISENSNGYLISWKPPLERNNLVEYYKIKYRTDGNYKNLNRNEIRPEETSYLVKNLVRGRTYHFKVLAYISKNFESSDEIKYVVPAIQYQFQYGSQKMEEV